MANVIYVSDLKMDEEQIDLLYSVLEEKGIDTGYDLSFTHVKKEEWNLSSPDVERGEIVVFNYDTPPDVAKNSITPYGEKGCAMYYPKQLIISDRKVYDDDPEWLVAEWEEVEYVPIDLSGLEG